MLESPVLWRPRRVRVRIADRPVDAAALQRLSEAVRSAGDAEGIMIAALGGVPPSPVPSDVMLVQPSELIARLERSASVAWPDRTPQPAYDRMQTQRDLERDAYLLDPVGLRWLPSLALHELPTELASANIAPEDLFERVAFRLMTSALRFGGEGFGEAARGQRARRGPEIAWLATSARVDGLQGNEHGLHHGQRSLLAIRPLLRDPSR